MKQWWTQFKIRFLAAKTAYKSPEMVTHANNMLFFWNHCAHGNCVVLEHRHFSSTHSSNFYTVLNPEQSQQVLGTVEALISADRPVSEERQTLH